MATAKMMNVNLLAVMGGIVNAHVKSYAQDFEIDAQVMRRAAEEQGGGSFVWLCRERGTWLLNEREVFMIGTSEYNKILFYREQNPGEDILAFAVEVTGADSEGIYGNLYQMDYDDIYRQVKRDALPVQDVSIRFERGEDSCALKDFTVFRFEHPSFGKTESFEYRCADEDALNARLEAFRTARAQASEAEAFEIEAIA